MKNMKIACALLFFIVFQSCCSPFMNCEDDFVEPVSRYEPVFLNRAEFNNSVALKNSISIGTTGKIYVKENFLFINELYKGFHVYDNSDPTNPTSFKFIAAPGATDMAIRSNMIYINQATDLIAVEYNPATNAIALAKRIPDTFPVLRSPDGDFAFDVPENTVVIDWKLKN